jgi:hypothetical protein
MGSAAGPLLEHAATASPNYMFYFFLIVGFSIDKQGYRKTAAPSVARYALGILIPSVYKMTGPSMAGPLMVGPLHTYSPSSVDE